MFVDFEHVCIAFALTLFLLFVFWCKGPRFCGFDAIDWYVFRSIGDFSMWFWIDVQVSSWWVKAEDFIE